MATEETILIQRLKQVEKTAMNQIAAGDLGVTQGKEVCENARARWSMLSQLRHSETVLSPDEFAELDDEYRDAIADAMRFIDFASEQGLLDHAGN